MGSVAKGLNNERRVDHATPVWTDIKGLLVMLQSPQGQAPVDHDLGALPLDWVEPKPLPKIFLKFTDKKKASSSFSPLILISVPTYLILPF